MNNLRKIIRFLNSLIAPKSDYGYKRIWIKHLGKFVYFCKKCGEYITKDTGCSNPICPEKVDYSKYE